MELSGIGHHWRSEERSEQVARLARDKNVLYPQDRELMGKVGAHVPCGQLFHYGLVG